MNNKLKKQVHNKLKEQIHKEYILEGLGCANCAAKIESALNAQEDVIFASVNFMNATLKLEIINTYEGNILEMIEKTVHRFEPDIIITDKGRKKNYHEVDRRTSKLILMIVGAVFFSIGIFLENIFDINIEIELATFIAAYLILGGEVVTKAIRNIFKSVKFDKSKLPIQIFDSRFLDENFLMSVATIGAFFTGDFAEAVGVMLFYQVGEFFQDSAVHKSKKSIADLMDIRPDYANLKIVISPEENELIKVEPDRVKVGDIIVVKPGEKIPLDGIVIEGKSMVDTMALTGESVPRTVAVSDSVLSGCINQNGVLTIEVTKIFGESTVAKIIELVENASSKKAPTENFITTFSKYYTPIVVGLAVLLAVISPLFFGGVWSEWIHRGLLFLVISCPCALVISIPLGFFGGIGAASRRGILIKGGNYLEALNNLDIVVFDKTGTLTKGVFEVTNMYPVNGFHKEELLEITANAEIFSNHPIAMSILNEYGNEIHKDKISNYNESSGYGISVIVDGKKVLVGNDKLMIKENILFTETIDIGTKIYVAVDEVFAGCIVISDTIKTDSGETIEKLKDKGIRKTVMLTGDNPQIAEAIAKKLRLDEVHSKLLPVRKVEKVEMLDGQKKDKGKLAFVGDGINDAPVLARADIGIAMGGFGSDAAIEAADVVLMTDEPSKLIEAIDIAKATKRIVWQNIVFALGIKGLFLLLGAFGVATMWEAVFADVGVSVLAILNSMRMLRIKI